MAILLLLGTLWLGLLLRLSDQELRRAPLGWVVWAGEDFGDAAVPVRVDVMGWEIAVRRILQIDEFTFSVVEAEDLYPSRQRLVPQFLLPSPVELLLVPARRITQGDSVDLRDVHVSKAVGFDGFVVEPRAVARFPLEAADHAEFGTATTGHVVAAFLELDGRGAVEAALPSFFFRDLDKFLRGGVFGTFAAGVPFVVARAADFRLTPLAFAELPASVGAAAGIDGDMSRFDP